MGLDEVRTMLLFFQNCLYHGVLRRSGQIIIAGSVLDMAEVAPDIAFTIDDTPGHCSHIVGNIRVGR